MRNQALTLPVSELIKQDYHPFGELMPGRKFSTSTYRFGFNGKENLNEIIGTGRWQDYGMRMSRPDLGRFFSVDPIASKYPNLTPYQFASNRPIDGVDQDGLEWHRIDGGYEWDPDDAYTTGADGSQTLKDGYYLQAITFNDHGTFNVNSMINMGTSTATVFKADGSTQDFSACIYPSKSIYTPLPEGDFEAHLGYHYDFIALKMHSIGHHSRLYLGRINNMHPNQTDAHGGYSIGSDIHHNYNTWGFTGYKMGVDPKTGKPKEYVYSENCFLIDKNQWDKFIKIFNRLPFVIDQTEFGITVFHSNNTPYVGYCGTNPTNSATPCSNSDPSYNTVNLTPLNTW